MTRRRRELPPVPPFAWTFGSPLDNCCPAHLSRYEHRRELDAELASRAASYRALVEMYEQ